MLALIEMNLLPGGKRSAPGPRKRRKPSGPKLGLSQAFRGDPLVAAIFVAGIGAVVYSGYTFVAQARTLANLEERIEIQVQDSARYAGIIAAADSLKARQDTLQRKIDIIRTIDSDRFIWSHIMDEVSRALPDFTWLSALRQTSGPPSSPGFRVEGMTGSTRALTRFMRDLEASPFLRGIKLVSVEQLQQGSKTVNSFVLQAQYEHADSTVIVTEPIILAGE